MQFIRKLALTACAVSSLAITVNLAQAAPGAGSGQAATSVLSTEAAPGAGPFVQKAWWHHHCWHCGGGWGWGWHHHHHWHHW
jgi:hypothetical protein